MTLKFQIVEPDPTPSPEGNAVSIFADAGWPDEDASWLGPLCYRFMRSGPTDEVGPDSTTAINLKTVAEAAKVADPHRSRDRALLTAYVRVCGCGGNGLTWAFPMPTAGEPPLPERRPGIQQWKELADAFRKPGDGIRGIDFDTALAAGGWPGDYGTDDEIVNGARVQARYAHYDKPPLLRTMEVLAQGAGVDLARLIDPEELVAVGRERGAAGLADPRRVIHPPDRTRVSFASPRSLAAWAAGWGIKETLHQFLPTFQACPDQDLAAMAVGVQDAIERWLMNHGYIWTHFHSGGWELADAALPYLKHLESRSTATGDIQLRKAWQWFAWCVYSAKVNLWRELAQDRKDVLLRAATEDLAKLRPLFARADLKTPPSLEQPVDADHPRAPWEEFQWEREHFGACATFLYQFGGVWRGMKPLLLALRALACPSVAKDLRYWAEPTSSGDGGELAQPPDPWYEVPASMINLFHHFVRDEQAADPELTELRGHLAAFCLERLGDRWDKARRTEAAKGGRGRSDDDMVERSPYWRLCLIRAAAGLYINPEGKGHRVLLKSSAIDPHEDVRSAAHDAYQQMRRSLALPENVSPRRAVVSALWWIRQAHLLGLEIRPDKDGAQRTRVKELSRTKEVVRSAGAV